MTSQNEQAEDLMKHVEEEEERMSVETPLKRYYHFCIINLVLGTLYCAKGNHEFGITRVIKSMEPMNKKV
jgi:tetratricopeptide repeat protein 30